MNDLSRAIRPNRNNGIRRRGLSREGFSLLELMIAMAVSTIVLGGIYSSHATQTSIHRTESQVSDLQQNLRGALYIISREIRMAGYDPTRKALAGIVLASPDAIRFTYDVTNNAGTPDKPDGKTDDILEDITYWVENETLIRKARFESGDAYPPERNEPAALGIDALSFAYAFDANLDGSLDASGGNVIWAYDANNNGKLDTRMDGSTLDPEVENNLIRAIQIWILAKTRHEVLNSPGHVEYIVGNKEVVRDDAFKRQLATTTIMCRNMGL